MTTPEERLAELGITLPEAPAPAAAYVPWTRSGNLVMTAGQVAVSAGQPVATGKVGAEVDTETAAACARQCAINVIAQLKAALGELSAVRHVLRIGVFVASTPEFTDQHLVANGASELFGEVFGDAGRHARTSVGVPSLPMDSPVEVEALVEAS